MLSVRCRMRTMMTCRFECKIVDTARKGGNKLTLRQRKAIERANREKILRVCPEAKDESGIYFLLREEDGFRYAYIGQSVHVLRRLAEHMMGFQHIDNSIRRHKLWSEDNPTGWRIGVMYFPEEELNEREQYYIKQYANAGYQMRNATSGSQGQGKRDILDAPTKGYLEGLHNGYKKAQKEIAHLFRLHLVCGTKKEPPTKLQERAMEKFKDFIGEEA